MYRRQVTEAIPEENTKVWSCSSDDCNGWMRSDFTFEHDPACPLCSSKMVLETRMLPLLQNTTGDFKAGKKETTATTEEK
ncbi:cold-shock protein [Paenibacillus sp. JX-17]|uniref:Cold-shock protein n=1 Tax=Paenibacillus lacisoli TaxID=3064525 RepID=A0ABT9CAT6_9BACL|nr:cold-shock protein [Paenibacillus sp. JX-17]MDO7906362.1 cold-shock protein [Paenibacillus sp. JX-17]